MKVAALTQQVGNYHRARYRACVDRFEAFTVISTMNEADFSEFLAAGHDELAVTNLFTGRAAYEDARQSGRLWARTAEALQAADPDVVAVAGWIAPESLSAIVWARDRGRKLVMLSESQKADAQRSPLREAVKRCVVRACDAGLVGGRGQADYITELGMPAARVFQGYDAVDNGHFARGAAAARVDEARARRTHGLPDRYLLASARFIAKKNLPRLIEAYALATRGLADAPELVILGDGAERPAIEAAMRAYGVSDQVSLLGYRTYETLPVFYGLAEAFIHVSLTEQWGLVINEAAAAGAPMIVSETCGAAPELMRDGLNGYLVSPARTDDIASAIRRMIEAGPAAREAMGRESRRLVADWGPERFASGLHSACEVAVAQPRRALAPWDRALLRMLARTTGEKVS